MNENWLHTDCFWGSGPRSDLTVRGYNGGPRDSRLNKAAASG